MIILSVALILGCLLEKKYINDSLNWLINSLETLQIEVRENKDKLDTEELISECYVIHNTWHNRVKTLKCLIWHTGIKDMEVGLARIAVYVEGNDYNEVYAEIASLIDYCAHYLDDFRVSVENVL